MHACMSQIKIRRCQCRLKDNYFEVDDCNSHESNFVKIYTLILIFPNLPLLFSQFIAT